MIVFMKASNLEIFADQGVIITDTKGIIVGVNKLAYQKYGIPSSCCYGKVRIERCVSINTLLPSLENNELQRLSVGQSMITQFDTSSLRYFVTTKPEVASDTYNNQKVETKQGQELQIERADNLYEDDEMSRLKKYSVKVTYWDQQVLGGGQRLWKVYAIALYSPVIGSLTNQQQSYSATHEDIGCSNSEIVDNKVLVKGIKKSHKGQKQVINVSDIVNNRQDKQSNINYAQISNHDSSRDISRLQSVSNGKHSSTNELLDKQQNSQNVYKQIKETKKFLKSDRIPKVIWVMLAIILFVSLFCAGMTALLMIQRLRWSADFLRLAKIIPPFYGIFSIVTDANVKLNQIYLLSSGLLTATSNLTIPIVQQDIEDI